MSKLDEIKKALQAATPGPWKWVDVYKKNDFEKYNMGGFVNEEGKLICHFGNRIDYYPTEGEPPDYDDELLIANAPEWLGFLLDELERLEREYAEERAAHNAHVTELCELEQERDMYKSSSEVFLEWFHEELEQKQQEIERLRAELEDERRQHEFEKMQHDELRETVQKLIEGLRFYVKLNPAYTGHHARRVLKEIGVTTDA